MVQDLTTSFENFEIFAVSEMAKQDEKSETFEQAFIPKYWTNILKIEPYNSFVDTSSTGESFSDWFSPRRSDRIANQKKVNYNETNVIKNFKQTRKRKYPPKSNTSSEASDTSLVSFSQNESNRFKRTIRTLFQKPRNKRFLKTKSKCKAKRDSPECEMTIFRTLSPLSVTKASLKLYEDELANSKEDQSAEEKIDPENFEEKKTVPSFIILNKNKIISERSMDIDPVQVCSVDTNSKRSEDTGLTTDFKTLQVSDSIFDSYSKRQDIVKHNLVTDKKVLSEDQSQTNQEKTADKAAIQQFALVLMELSLNHCQMSTKVESSSVVEESLQNLSRTIEKRSVSQELILYKARNRTSCNPTVPDSLVKEETKAKTSETVKHYIKEKQQLTTTDLQDSTKEAKNLTKEVLHDKVNTGNKSIDEQCFPYIRKKFRKSIVDSTAIHAPIHQKQEDRSYILTAMETSESSDSCSNYSEAFSVDNKPFPTQTEMSLRSSTKQPPNEKFELIGDEDKAPTNLRDHTYCQARALNFKKFKKSHSKLSGSINVSIMEQHDRIETRADDRSSDVYIVDRKLSGKYSNIPVPMEIDENENACIPTDGRKNEEYSTEEIIVEPKITLNENPNDYEDQVESVDNGEEMYAESNESDDVEIVEDNDSVTVDDYDRNSETETSFSQGSQPIYQQDFIEVQDFSFLPQHSYFIPRLDRPLDENLRSYISHRLSEFQLPQMHLSNPMSSRVQFNPYGNLERESTVEITELSKSDEEREEDSETFESNQSFKIQIPPQENRARNQFLTLTQPPPISSPSVQQRLNSKPVTSQDLSTQNSSIDNNHWKIVSYQNNGQKTSYDVRDDQLYGNTIQNVEQESRNPQIFETLCQNTWPSNNYQIHNQPFEGHQAFAQNFRLINNAYVHDVKFGRSHEFNGRVCRSGGLSITFGNNYTVQVLGDLVPDSISSSLAFDAYFGLPSDY